MDFTYDEDLVAVRDLAREIFSDRATTDRVREVEGSATHLDEELWQHLASAGLLGLALPESCGGAALDLAALCVVLEEQGRTVAPVPLWSAGVASLAVASFGTPAQRDELLAGAADGTLRITLALEEFDGVATATPRCAATRAGERWSLTGAKAVVPSPFGASHVLVSATGPSGPGLFLIPTEGDGIA